MGFFDNLFSNNSDKTIREVTVAGHQLSCPICGGRQFWTRNTLMNTQGMALLDIDWANKQAQNFICDECGYIFWFMPRE
jgi:predicted nucleic-acid-binding Zn-ribbon protein